MKTIKRDTPGAEFFGRLSKALLALAVGLVVFCVAPQVGSAQNVPADEEEQVDGALRKFGFVSGQSFQCKTAAADKTKAEKAALEMANGVLRLFGSDRAFYFAAAFGSGLTKPIDQSKCGETQQRYETMMSKLKTLASK